MSTTQHPCMHRYNSDYLTVVEHVSKFCDFVRPKAFLHAQGSMQNHVKSFKLAPKSSILKRSLNTRNRKYQIPKYNGEIAKW
jgi:hypothetical protein